LTFVGQGKNPRCKTDAQPLCLSPQKFFDDKSSITGSLDYPHKTKPAGAAQTVLLPLCGRRQRYLRQLEAKLAGAGRGLRSATAGS
jgi:hypothetical protein